MSLRGMFAISRETDPPLYECETALTDPEVRSSRERVEALLHADFTETGSGGEVYDRATIIEMMTTGAPGEVVIRDFAATHLSSEIALVTYRSIGTSGQEARRTSIWVLEDGRWQLRHHQGTRVPDHWGRVR